MDANKKTFSLLTGAKLILCILFMTMILMKLFKKVDAIILDWTALDLELLERIYDLKINLVLINLYAPMLIGIMCYLALHLTYGLLVKYTNLRMPESIVKTYKDKISVIALKVVVGTHISSITLATGFVVTHSDLSNILGIAWVLCSTFSIPVMIVYGIIFVALYFVGRHNNKVQLEPEN